MSSKCINWIKISKLLSISTLLTRTKAKIMPHILLVFKKKKIFFFVIQIALPLFFKANHIFQFIWFPHISILFLVFHSIILTKNPFFSYWLKTWADAISFKPLEKTGFMVFFSTHRGIIFFKSDRSLQLCYWYCCWCWCCYGSYICILLILFFFIFVAYICWSVIRFSCM